MQGQIMKRLAKISRAVALFLIFIPLFPLGARADYYLTDNELYGQYIPDAYNEKAVLLCMNGPGVTLQNPKDLFVDAKDHVYIADTGNNRILELDSQLNYLGQYPRSAADRRAMLNGPQGVYVDSDGDLYIADTGNSRIVHLSADGRFVEQFGQPKEETFDTSFSFHPTKIAVDRFGVMYVLNDKDYHGIITLDAKGHFAGYIGTVKTKFNLQTYILRLVATKEQLSQVAQTTPPYYTNLTLAKDGTIYASDVFENSAQLKRLTPAGNNVYEQKFFGETNNQKAFNGQPDFQDIAVDSNGIVFAADSLTGGLYVYDQDGNNLAIAGGVGNTQQTFKNISSIAVDSKENLYVLDMTMNAIQVLEPTDFLRSAIKGVTYYNDGNYNAALKPFQNVLRLDSSYLPAQAGVAKAYLQQGENRKALDTYVKALDKKGYSDAFEKIRLDVFRNDFGWVALIGLMAIVALYWVVRLLYRYAGRISNRMTVQRGRLGLKFMGETAVLVLFHPIDAFYRIKVNRQKIRSWPLLLFFVLLVTEKVLYRSLIHFPLESNVVDINYVHDVLLFLVPLVSWMIVSFAITTISDGKQTLKESLIGNAYCFVPYLLLYLPITALSNLMALHEAGLYYGLQSLLMLWCLLLIFCNLKVSNEYPFKKAVFTVLKILFAILCMWMIVFLFYIVISQFVTFIKEVVNEGVYMFKR